MGAALEPPARPAAVMPPSPVAHLRLPAPLCSRHPSNISKLSVALVPESRASRVTGAFMPVSSG
jgi:hypothetical protein